ncbi:MAG: ComEC/Rec2 family competence protein [Eubacteriales bacterium]
MKLKTLFVTLLATLMLLPVSLLALTSCSVAEGTGGSTSGTSGTQGSSPEDDTTDVVKMKFFKAGRSTCIVIRTPAGVVMIDTAADDQTDSIISYLAEKGITTVDYLIITNFSKKHIGGAPAILTQSGVTFKNVLVPGYVKESGTYQLFSNAMISAGLTATPVTDNSTTFTLGEVSFSLYAPHKDYSTAIDENDEGNSLAVAVTYKDTSFLMTSRVAGERVDELISDLSGQTFDLITVPNYGIYDSRYDALFTALGARYAVAICSNNAEKDQMHDETLAALKNAGITVYATRDGSVEIRMDGTNVTVQNDHPALNIG